ncbi:helix-turn-helix domain-containing protein [Brevundimonas sp.]|uniref:helix-turn-helix domain-containing protein n=1 Tax=Brevundimonas sp. TaxID=1871086 RepID=UPI001AD5B024|nr:helix-turn-helix domain-containing protein [Brevundimonas sp.]MBN9465066.1 helix-turn-helix domain-containing protein [Brevundimonas sp.]
MTSKSQTPEQHRDHDFAGIMSGLNEAVAHAEGRPEGADVRVHAPESVDVAAIRKGQKLTQEGFASAYGLPVATVRDWEQHRREPDTGSRLLLKVIQHEPEAVRRALAG